LVEDVQMDGSCNTRSRPMEAASHALGSDTKLRLDGRSWLASFDSRADLMQPGPTDQVMPMNRKGHGPNSSGGHDVIEKVRFDRTVTS
jgi:hypothetical protein